MSRLIRVGVVARPQGLSGELVITLDHAGSDSLRHVRVVRMGEQSRHLRRVRPGRPGQAIVDVGLGSRDDAEGLRGAEVRVDEAELPPLGANEYWHSDLLGLTAVDAAGAELGKVEEVVDTAEVAVLVVRSAGGEWFVPMADPYVIEIDVKGGRLKVAPPAE